MAITTGATLATAIGNWLARADLSSRIPEFVALADKYADLGPLYHPTAKLREMAANGQRFYG